MLEITALGLLRGLLRQPLSLAYFFCGRLTIFDTGCAIGDRDADISSHKRKLLDDFFSQLGLRASTREVFQGKKSEVRQSDDYRTHRTEFSNLKNQDEGKIPANRAKADTKFSVIDAIALKSSVSTVSVGWW